MKLWLNEIMAKLKANQMSELMKCKLTKCKFTKYKLIDQLYPLPKLRGLNLQF